MNLLLKGKNSIENVSSLHRMLNNYKVYKNEPQSQNLNCQTKGNFGNKNNQDNKTLVDPIKFMQSVNDRLKELEDRNLKKFYNEINLEFSKKQIELIVQQSLFVTVNKKKLFLNQRAFDKHQDNIKNKVERIILERNTGINMKKKVLPETISQINKRMYQRTGQDSSSDFLSDSRMQTAKIEGINKGRLESQNWQKTILSQVEVSSSDDFYTGKHSNLESSKKLDLNNHDINPELNAVQKTQTSNNTLIKNSGSIINKMLSIHNFDKSQIKKQIFKRNESMSDRQSMKVNFLTNISRSNFLPKDMMSKISKRNLNSNREIILKSQSTTWIKQKNIKENLSKDC